MVRRGRLDREGRGAGRSRPALADQLLSVGGRNRVVFAREPRGGARFGDAFNTRRGGAAGRPERDVAVVDGADQLREMSASHDAARRAAEVPHALEGDVVGRGRRALRACGGGQSGLKQQSGGQGREAGEPGADDGESGRPVRHSVRGVDAGYQEGARDAGVERREFGVVRGGQLHQVGVGRLRCMSAPGGKPPGGPVVRDKGMRRTK